MALPYFEVVRVMRRRNLNGTGAKLAVNKLVGNNRDFTVCQWELNGFTNKVFVAIVFGVDGHSGITQHRLWTGGCNNNAPLPVDEWIFEVPQMAILQLMHYLYVRKC